MNSTTIVLVMLVISILLIMGAATLAIFQQTTPEGVNRVRLRYYAFGLAVGGVIMWIYHS